MYVVILQIPCSDDMIGPFSTEKEAEDWIIANQLQPGEYSWGSLTDKSVAWKRN